MKKGLVCLSGGFDSATTAYHIKQHGIEVEAVFVDYGQYWSLNELASARYFAKLLHIPLHELDLSPVSRSLAGLGEFPNPPIIPLMDGTSGPHKNDGDDTVTPQSLKGFIGLPAPLGFVVFYALLKQIEDIYFGIHKDDISTAPRLLDSFQLVADSFNLLNDSNIRIIAPFAAIQKIDVLKAGQSLGVPVQHSWSCVEPHRSIQCGECGSCRKRKAIFKQAGIVDTTTYKS